MSSTSAKSQVVPTGILELHEDTALLQLLGWAAHVVESSGVRGAPKANPPPTMPSGVAGGSASGARSAPPPAGAVSVGRAEFEQLQQSIFALFDSAHLKAEEQRSKAEEQRSNAEAWDKYLQGELQRVDKSHEARLGSLEQQLTISSVAKESSFTRARWLTAALLLMAAVLWCASLQTTINALSLKVDDQAHTIETLKKSTHGESGVP
jgi:hypothetical protein